MNKVYELCSTHETEKQKESLYLTFLCYKNHGFGPYFSCLKNLFIYNMFYSHV